ncbi:MAG: hypothetical protein R2750_03015 [Bacteroidales bacterium]
MKGSEESKIIEKLDEAINVATNKKMMESYYTTDLQDLIEDNFKEIISLLPPLPDTEKKKNK